MMRMYDIIEKKRDGGKLTAEEMRFFIEGYCRGDIPDYQVSALLMAIFLRGMDGDETASLTMIMAQSGDQLDLSSIPGIKIDKHSTGGVGDKTTLVVAPVTAACGVPVAKMSGRGLGHTGGTIDKLESIPGFKTTLSMEEFFQNVKEIGISITGQTGNLAPADKKLYALRDVTATVNCIPLIASSIMSKKIASGADGIVLDVKCGSGAFMKTPEHAAVLAKAMVEIGKKVGRKTAAIITDMDTPLGNAIGNSLEVIEAIETLKGKGPQDFTRLCLEISAKMLELAGAGDMGQCRKKAERAISSGEALDKFRQMIKRQKGDTGVLDCYDCFSKASMVREVYSDVSGYVKSMATDRLGVASMVLGAGRETKESVIDYAAGILLVKKTGMKVEKGEPLAYIYTNLPNRIHEAEMLLKSSYIFSEQLPEEKPLILSSIG